VFLLAWISLGAAIASLYFGLSEEGRAFLYMSMGASLLTVVLAVAHLFRARRARETASVRSAWDPPATAADPGSDPAGLNDDSNEDPSSSGSSRPG
jgi:hypothetical protein